MTRKWEDHDYWASWQNCAWEPDSNPQMWECSLPHGHSGPHIGYLNMENDPTGESYIAAPDGSVWMQPSICHICGTTHPGFRHSTNNDRIVIAYNFAKDAWGPDINHEFPDGSALQFGQYVPMFVDAPFPTPPKFNTMEEAEAWLEANPP